MLDFLSAFSLVLILEGIILFISPKRLIKLLEVIAKKPETHIRFIGGISVFIGIVLLWIIRK